MESRQFTVILAGASSNTVNSRLLAQLKHIGFSPVVKSQILAVLDDLENTNMNWAILLYINFAAKDPQIFEYWNDLLLAQELGGFGLESSVLKACFSTCFQDSLISWFTSVILIGEIEFGLLDLDQINDLVKLYKRDGFEGKFLQLLQKNRDLTCLVNVIKILKYLNLWHPKFDVYKSGGIIEYIHQQSPVFWNAFQLVKMVCLEENKLSIDGSLILMQVVANTMIIWISDQESVQINLFNLYRWNVVGDLVRLQFKKLSRANTVSHRLNNFSLDVKFKHLRFINPFIRRLEAALRWKPKRVAISIPVNIHDEVEESEDSEVDVLFVSNKRIRVNSDKQIAIRLDEVIGAGTEGAGKPSDDNGPSIPTGSNTHRESNGSRKPYGHQELSSQNRELSDNLRKTRGHKWSRERSDNRNKTRGPLEELSSGSDLPSDSPDMNGPKDPGPFSSSIPPSSDPNIIQVAQSSHSSQAYMYIHSD